MPVRAANCLLMLIGISTPSFAEEDPGNSNESSGSVTDVQFVGATDYVTGNLGELDYETISIGAGVIVTKGRFTFSASLPYVSTTAPEDLIVSGGGLLGTSLFATPTSATRETTREGLGDLLIQGAYIFPVAGLDAQVASSVKVPTASRRKGLGSGKLDFGASGQISKRLGAVIPFVGVGYTILGDPEGFDVRNTISGTTGAYYLVGESTSISLAYGYEQSATAEIGDRQNIGIGLGTNLSSQVRLGLDGSAGLSKDAPDARVGLRLGLGF